MYVFTRTSRETGHVLKWHRPTLSRTALDVNQVEEQMAGTDIEKENVYVNVDENG
jgi:hypothetical protein